MVSAGLGMLVNALLIVKVGFFMLWYGKQASKP
jgi:hypothetical protein